VKLLFNSEEKLPFVALLFRSKCEDREDPEFTGDFSRRRVVVFSLEILGLKAIFNSYYFSSYCSLTAWNRLFKSMSLFVLLFPPSKEVLEVD